MKKNKNYFSSQNFKKILPENLEIFLRNNNKKIFSIIHLGAITSTTERNLDLIIKNNLELSIFFVELVKKKKD